MEEKAHSDPRLRPAISLPSLFLRNSRHSELRVQSLHPRQVRRSLSELGFREEKILSAHALSRPCPLSFAKHRRLPQKPFPPPGAADPDLLQIPVPPLISLKLPEDHLP